MNLRDESCTTMFLALGGTITLGKEELRLDLGADVRSITKHPNSHLAAEVENECKRMLEVLLAGIQNRADTFIYGVRKLGCRNCGHRRKCENCIKAANRGE